MIGIDTNVLVRYLTQDEPRQSAAATQLIERRLTRQKPGFVSAIVVAELCWVLRSLYAVDAGELADTIEDLLSAPVFHVEGRDALRFALARARSKGAQIPDALIHEIGLAAGCTLTCTFDRRAAKTSGMSLLAS